MDKNEILDKLNRAYEMEEAMSGILIDLCQPEALSEELSEKDRKRIGQILFVIKEDTLQHKEIVLGIKNYFK